MNVAAQVLRPGLQQQREDEMAAGLKAAEGHGGAVTLIQRFGSAANLNIRPHCLVRDSVYRCNVDGVPAFVEVDAPTDDVSPDINDREDRLCLANAWAAAPWRPVIEKILTHQ